MLITPFKQPRLSFLQRRAEAVISEWKRYFAQCLHQFVEENKPAMLTSLATAIFSPPMQFIICRNSSGLLRISVTAPEFSTIRPT